MNVRMDVETDRHQDVFNLGCGLVCGWRKEGGGLGVQMKEALNRIYKWASTNATRGGKENRKHIYKDT